MSEANGNGNGNGNGRGVQAYRLLQTGGIALLGVLLMRVLAGVDKTTEKIDALQIQVIDMKGSTDSRINAHAQRLDSVDRRNDQQDTKLEELQRWMFRRPDTTRGTP